MESRLIKAVDLCSADDKLSIFLLESYGTSWVSPVPQIVKLELNIIHKLLGEVAVPKAFIGFLRGKLRINIYILPPLLISNMWLPM